MTESAWSAISTLESQIESLREENTEIRGRIEELERSLADSDEGIRRIIEDLLTSAIPSDGVWNELSPFPGLLKL
jgi:prefoldin subunit 5